MKGITDNVEQRQTNQLLISMDDEVSALGANVKVDAVCIRLAAERHTQAVKEDAHGEVGPQRLWQMGQFLIVAKEAADAVGLLVDDSERLLHVLVRDGVALHPVRQRNDRSNRVTQLVGHHTEDTVIVLPLRLHGIAVGAIGAEHTVHVVKHSTQHRVV